MKRLSIAFMLLLIIVPATLVACLWLNDLPGVAKPTPNARATPTVPPEVEQSIQEAISEQQEDVLALLMYDTHVDQVQFSDDGEWAVARLTPVDTDSGQIIPAEHGLAILRRDGDGWRAFLPSDPEWFDAIQLLPSYLVPDWVREALVQHAISSSAPETVGSYGGYYLPWAGGETMALTQSVGHDRYTPSGNAHFAFDFAKPGYPSGMYDIHAAKGGFVKQAVWTNPDHSEKSPGNYIVLEDPTTTPTTYQLYLHLAQDSIPQALRSVGASVAQGQFVGVADDTGVSSGNHLHFHVHTTSVSYWGRSVDITFEDVEINGGRPRIPSDLSYCRGSDVCDETQRTYVSGNYMNPDYIPPRGGLNAPQHGAIAEADTLHLDGWATDENSGLARAQLIAKYNGNWHTIGDEFTSEQFTLDWDMCDAQVPDGPVSLALELEDKAFNINNNLPGLLHITKRFTCPPAHQVCEPTQDQVALFAEIDYQGACVILDKGDHTTSSSLGDLGENNAVSIRVGADVQAALFMQSTLQGRGETFFTHDSNLGDNRIGAKTVSSVLVQDRQIKPSQPTLVWPTNNATFSSDDSFTLSWDDAGGAALFQARITPNSGGQILSPWQAEPFWHLNSMATGGYTWQAKAKNGQETSEWTAPLTFDVTSSTSPPPSTFTAPFTDTMETPGTHWINSNYWDRTSEENHTSDGSKSWKYDTSSGNGYDTGLPNSGHLTSPPIIIPTNDDYYLRFWYFYETESPGTHFDQRWLQISVDGGEFINIFQLSDDATNFWLRSPAIPLKDYAGHTIQARFYFSTLDSIFNAYRGWYIDDFSIRTHAPDVCQDTNNTYLGATPINYGSKIDAEICPAGDIDYYKFQGFEGDQIGAHISAKTIGSELDSYLYLLDINGRSVLEENDDLVLRKMTDSHVTYQLTRTGTYYLKVRSWDHTTSGGQDYNYRLRLVKDNDTPDGRFLYPLDGIIIPSTPIALTVSASDITSGISRVQFLWHPSDWKNSDWIILGDDWDGADGWTFSFNVSDVTVPHDIAFYARIYDWAGNWIGTGVWNINTPKLYLPLTPNGY